MAEQESQTPPGKGGAGEAVDAAGEALSYIQDSTPPADRQALLAAAKALHDRGLAVVPILARKKSPSIEAWQERRLDWPELAEHLSRNGTGGIGVVGGALSGNLVVADFDGDGWQGAHEHFMESWPELAATPQIRTGSGKRHVWLVCPDLPADFTRRTFARPDLGAAIELRGNRHQSLAPPSLHPSGARYAWLTDGLALASLPFAELRDWLAAWAGEAVGTPHGDGHHAAATGPTIPQGQRNTALASLAGSLRRRGASQEAIVAALQAENLTRCEPPLPEGEVLGIAVGIARYEPATVDDTRPAIDAGIQDLDRATTLAWAIVEAANDPPLLFVHGGQLARLEVGEPAPTLATVDVDRLRYEAARAARWYVNRKIDGLWETADARPPVAVVRNMLARPTGELVLPPVDRIVRSPVFASDGTLQRAPGYHAPGRVIVCTDPALAIPEIAAHPAPEDISAAVATIDDLLGDFPFVGAADRAHAFALLLGPLVRDMIPGPTPLHLVESATPGSGKGLLVLVLLTPAMGDEVATMAAGRDDEEWRKRLTTVLRAGQPAVMIDNVRESIDAAALSSALTALWWDDRILGANELLHLPVRCVWAATGNNPMLSTEIARRTVRIRLDPKMDQPWRREASAFTHPELLTYAQARRGELLAAGLTLAQAWIAAGQPRAKTPPLGSYEPWVRVIGGILAHAGIGGFLANLDELYERADSEGAVWRRFVGAWWEGHGDNPVGVADLYPLALGFDDFPLGDGQERSQKIVLGKELKRKEDVVLAGYRIEAAGAYKRLAQYRLRRAYIPMTGGIGVSGVSGACSHRGDFLDRKENQGGPGDTPDTPHTPADDMAAYTAYRQAAEASGVEPLNVPEWQDAGRPGAPPEDGQGVALPLLITRAMRARLEDLGYSGGQIDAMTPVEAWAAFGR